MNLIAKLGIIYATLHNDAGLSEYQLSILTHSAYTTMYKHGVGRGGR